MGRLFGHRNDVRARPGSASGLAIYWSNNVTFPTFPSSPDPALVGRANLNGTGVDTSVFPRGTSCGVAVDDNYVYWGAGAIERASLDGVDVEPAFIPGVNAHCAVAVDDAHVYWLNGADAIDASGIGRAKLDGTSVETDWITGLNTPRGMTVGGGHVYWVNAEGDVGRADLDGSHADPEFIAGSGGAGSTGVAVDDAHIYWSNTWTGSIGRADLNGANVNQSFIVDPAPEVPGITFFNLAVDAGHLYWDEYPNRLGRARLDGTGVELGLVTGLRGVSRGVAVDGRSATSQALSTAPTTSVYGQPVTINALLVTTDTLVQSPAIPAGTVRFKVNDAPASPPMPVDPLGRATFAPPFPLDVGTRVSARYSGSGDLPVAGGFTPADRAAATTTALDTSANPATEGGEVEVVATVQNTETDVVPFGSVTFLIDGTQALPPVPLSEDGDAGVIATDLPPGDFHVEAIYEDDTADIPDFAKSRASYIQHVSAAPASPAGSPQPAPGPATPAVRAAPRLTVATPAPTTIAHALAHGLRIKVGCSEPCLPRARASIDARAARRFRLGSGKAPAVVGRSSRPTRRATRHTLRLTFSRRTRHALARARKVRLILRIQTADTAVTRRITLRRRR